MPTLNITAPGVNFKSAAPGSRGSFGCFGIRLDQSTSITSTGSMKTWTETALSHHHHLPQLINFTCCVPSLFLKVIHIKQTLFCSSQSQIPWTFQVRTSKLTWIGGKKKQQIKTLDYHHHPPPPNNLLHNYWKPFVEGCSDPAEPANLDTSLKHSQKSQHN